MCAGGARPITWGAGLWLLVATVPVQLCTAGAQKGGGYIPLSRDGKLPPKPPPKHGGRHELFAWVKACGGWSSEGLQVKSSKPIGRGLFATREVQAGDVLVSLPVSCTINSQTALADYEELRQAEAEISKSPVTSRKLLIAAFVLRKMPDPETRYAPYLSDLRGQAQPTIEAVPTFWKPEDGAKLRGTFASELLKSVLRATSEDWDVLTKALPDFGREHTLQEYQLAYSFVSSRTFTVSHEELGSFPALLPLIDIANHHLPEPEELLHSENGPPFARNAAHTALEVVSNVDGKFGKDTGFHVQLVAQKAHAKGEQVFFNYGLANNAHNAVQYGFVVPWIHNMTCLATASLHLEVDRLPERSQVDEWRKRLGRTAGELVTFQVDGCGGAGFDAVLSFARLWCARAEAKELEEACDLQGLTSDNPAKGMELSRWRLGTTCSLASPEAEMEALEFVREAVAKRRDQMAGGTLEDEEKLVAKRKLSPNRRAAATLRRDEKFVLRQVERDVEAAKERLHAAIADPGVDWRTYLEGLARDPLKLTKTEMVYSGGKDHRDEL